MGSEREVLRLSWQEAFGCVYTSGGKIGVQVQINEETYDESGVERERYIGEWKAVSIGVRSNGLYDCYVFVVYGFVFAVVRPSGSWVSAGM